MKFDKENLKALFTKERLIGIGIGAFVVALFAGSCWYAWYCGNQAYMENGGVAEPINAEVTEVVVEEVDAAVEEAEAEAERIKAEEAAAAEAEAKAAAEAEAAAAAQSYTNYNTTYSSSYNMPSSGLTMQSGVNYHDGRRETYYSSNVLYHYRTGEWTVDSEGFYRDANGYYVVAASDMAQGTTFEGSKGTCIVLDSGCAAGTTDYYVAW